MVGEKNYPSSSVSMSPDVIQPAGSSTRSPLAPGVREADTSEEIKRRVLGAGLHDLGNLLQVVLASTEEGLEVPDNPEVAQSSLDNCRAATQRAVDLLQVLSAQAAGRVISLDKPLPLRLRGVVEDVLGMMGAANPSKAKLVLTEVDTDVIASVDQGLFHRALMNLLRNAIEATSASAEIVVRISRDKQGSACVQVSDDGSGMDLETLSHAHERGFSSRGTGRGLGLAFVQDFTRASGGDLRLESLPGQGTTVEMNFPGIAD
ncbi:MAG: signal transduction histidine kinase [Planctomycetota bacterium]|jgi:signal transduction histidine kinase